jgi:hypothetical protein
VRVWSYVGVGDHPANLRPTFAPSRPARRHETPDAGVGPRWG